MAEYTCGGVAMHVSFLMMVLLHILAGEMGTDGCCVERVDVRSKFISKGLC